MMRSLLALLLFGILIPSLCPAEASAAEIVRYRLETWKRKHIHDNDKAARIADTLKKLGCEVEKADHNGHIDVKYRCPQWRQISPETADEAMRWEKWFKEYYFQTERRSS